MTTCCQCGAVDIVKSRYASVVKVQGGECLGPIPMPITWTCSVCQKPVCFNCTQTIEGSQPVEFFEQTFCSPGCKATVDTTLEELESLHAQRRDILRMRRLGHFIDGQQLERVHARIDTLQAPMAEAERVIFEARMAELVALAAEVDALIAPCGHAGERAIDRATGEETCCDCGEENPA